MLSIVQTINFADQAAKDQREWATFDRKGKKRPVAELDAYEAGVRHGYGQAIADMKLHGYKFKIN